LVLHNSFDLVNEDCDLPIGETLLEDVSRHISIPTTNKDTNSELSLSNAYTLLNDFDNLSREGVLGNVLSSIADSTMQASFLALEVIPSASPSLDASYRLVTSSMMSLNGYPSSTLDPSFPVQKVLGGQGSIPVPVTTYHESLTCDKLPVCKVSKPMYTPRTTTDQKSVAILSKFWGDDVKDTDFNDLYFDGIVTN